MGGQVALLLAVNYLLPAIVVILLLHRYPVARTVPARYRSTGLFALGVLLLVGYSAVRGLAGLVPGGGAGFMVGSLALYVVLPALVLLTIATVRFFIGVGRAAAGQPAFAQTLPGP
jgi:hypothetical protein